jgi:hemolysin activation/secretion protein
MNQNKNYSYTLAILLTLPWVSLKAAGPEIPSAGHILNQIQIQSVVPPGRLNNIPTMDIDNETVITEQDSIEFRIETIKISGNISIGTNKLHDLVSDVEGQNTTLSKLRDVTSRITNHYKKNGFSFARAIIPSQLMKEGILHIEVIEALYGEIELINQTGLSDTLLSSTLSEIKSGIAIQQKSLDHALLSIADIPGVIVSANLKAGGKTGETDLQIKVKNTNDYATGKTTLDNYGNSFLGTARVSQTIHMIDPFKTNTGETFDLNILSTGKNLIYSRIAYEKFNSNSTALRTGGAYSIMQYKLGGPLSESNSKGEAQVLQIWSRRSIFREYTKTITAQIQLDHTQLQDHSGTDIDNNRQTNKLITNITGEFEDEIWNKSSNNWNSSLTLGALNFENKDYSLSDFSNNEGKFKKVNANFIRTQKINAVDFLLTSMTIQYSNQNLDSSEKMVIGGANSVRGSNSNALSGDKAALLSVEYKHNLDRFLGLDWQISVFNDHAIIQINKNTLGNNQNRSRINGNGIALNFSNSNQTNIKIQLAKLQGASSGFSSQTIGTIRGWIEVNHLF